LAIKKGQRIGGYGVAWGALEEKEVELICCPLFDENETGRPNFPKSSCEARQGQALQKRCYGGCNKEKIYAEHRRRKAKERSGEYEALRSRENRLKRKAMRNQAIKDLYRENGSIAETARTVQMSEKFCHDFLVDEGLCEPADGRKPGEKSISLRARVFALLDGDETLTATALKDILKCRQVTASTYLRSWRELQRSGERENK